MAVVLLSENSTLLAIPLCAALSIINFPCDVFIQDFTMFCLNRDASISAMLTMKAKSGQSTVVGFTRGMQVTL